MTLEPNSGPIPSDKFDHASLERARALGFPALNPHIPALLEWLQDRNWPVFNDTADLLSTAGQTLLPHLRAILVSDDAEWMAAILADLCPRLPDQLLARLSPDIASLATRPDLRNHPEIPSLIRALA